MEMKNFSAYELVNEATYNNHGNASTQQFDRELLVFIDTLHGALAKFFKDSVSIVVNDWKWGGRFDDRGLRNPSYYGSMEAFDSSRSMHKYGSALDFDVYVDGKRIDPNVIRGWIINHRDLPWVYPITFIEDGVNWVHVDTRPTDNNLLIVWDINTGESVCYR